MNANPRSGWFAPGSPRRAEMDDCNQIWFDLLQALEEGFGGRRERLQQAVPLVLEFKRRANGLMNQKSGTANTVPGPSFEPL